MSARWLCGGCAVEDRTVGRFLCGGCVVEGRTVGRCLCCACAVPTWCLCGGCVVEGRTVGRCLCCAYMVPVRCLCGGCVVEGRTVGRCLRGGCAVEGRTVGQGTRVVNNLLLSQNIGSFGHPTLPTSTQKTIGPYYLVEVLKRSHTDKWKKPVVDSVLLTKLVILISLPPV